MTAQRLLPRCACVSIEIAFVGATGDLPVTIVTGTGDQIADPSGQAGRLHREVKGSQLVDLQDIGHMVHYSALPALIAAIEKTGERAWKPMD